ncbi:hypothetical protein [Cryobacterium adonitolivorans]|nr:hypothetical protein [Cryobacterium adonitolivorans]
MRGTGRSPALLVRDDGRIPAAERHQLVVAAEFDDAAGFDVWNG